MRIVAIDYRIVRWPIAPRGAARGLRATGASDRRVERATLILAVRGDGGATGLGEAAPLPGMSIDNLDDAVRACEALAARLPLTLEVPAHATAIADRITPAPAARFAIETALLAALAQHTRTSIASLVAPLVQRTRPSFAGMFASMPQAELISAVVVDDEHDASAAVAAGATCLKIKAPSPADLDRVHRIARAAPGTHLRIDANRGWPRTHVAELLDALAGLPIDYVEEPCRDAHELLHGFRSFESPALPVRIALDESLIELAPDELGHALESPHLAALVLKPTLLGFARCLELASLAHAHGVAPVVTHALEGPVGFAACRELARAISADVPVGLAAHAALEHFANAMLCATAPIHVARPPSSTPASRPTWVNDETIKRAHLAVAATPPATIAVAEHTHATLDAIYAALDARRPIALLHAKAPTAEQARQRGLVERATFEPDDAVVLFTSGSTGPSRGVVLSRAAIFAAADASAAHLGWRDDDRWLCALPLAHAGGLSIVIRCLAAQRPLLLGELADIDRATIASLVPAQLAQLLDDPTWYPPPQLRAVLLGGAACPAALLAAALARGVPVLPTYGLTETFGQVATARIPGGRPVPLPGVDITAGSRDAPAPIRIRGPMLATRYLDGALIAPELITADLGFVVHGELHVLGRADDVIVTGGENVHPTQVEAVLAATPGVRAAAVFGVPDARWGQVVAAAITVDTSFDHPRALDQWHSQLPPHARPRRLAIAQLPRLPSGKIDRVVVAALPTSPIDYAGNKPHA